MLDYFLKTNKLKGEDGRFCAQVVNTRSYTFEDIAQHLIKHNTGLSSSVIYGLWEGIKGAVEEFIAEGGAINTELFQVHASIRGVFNGLDDGFDGSRHRIHLNLRPGALLRDIPDKLKVKKLNTTGKSIILSVTDVKTGSVNDCLTPGKIMRICGNHVKIAGYEPVCGIYFIPEKSSGKTVKIESSEVVVNRPSQILAIVPKLGKGSWTLRLVTQYLKGTMYLKTPKSLTFDKSFSVA